MNCNKCDSSERFLIEAMVAADKAETALRCYLLTHERIGGVSDLDEFEALRKDQRASMDERDRAYTSLITHKQDHLR
jgi:hypothetical protein